MSKRDYRGRFKKRRYLSHTEARALFDRMYEAKEREHEAHLRTPEGERERQEFNRRQLERLRGNPRRRRGSVNAGQAANILTGLTHPEGDRADFHALRSDDVQYLLDTAKEVGYRAPKGASGSKARYFYAYLRNRKAMPVRSGKDWETVRRNPSRIKPRQSPIADTKTAADVARYLRSIKGSGAPRGVIPITLSVRGRTWQGARYIQGGAVRLYMIGDLPPAWRERKKTVFNIGRDLRDWYIAAHMSEPIPAQYAEYHPLGASFILSAWEVPGGESIDKYEAKPYTRVKAQLKRVK